MLFLIIAISCNTQIEIKNEVSYFVDLNNKSLNKNQKLSDIFKDARFILLDTTSNAMFGYISSLKMFEDTLYIFDSAQTRFVYKFKKNGKFIGRVGKLGKGPGEYLRPTDFDVNPQNGDVSILCWSTKKIYTYNYKGEFKRSFNSSGKFTSFATVNDLTYCAKSYSKEEPDDLFYCYNNKGNVLFSYFASSLYQNINKLVFRFGSPIYKFGETLKYLISCSDTIFSISDKTITPFLIFNVSNTIKNNLDDENLKLHAYSQNEDVAFLRLIIGNLPHDFFYFFSTGKIALYSYLRSCDDLTNLPTELLGIYGNVAIGTIDAGNIPYITSLIKAGKINNPEIIEYIRCQGNGTLLIFYEFKDEKNIDL